DGAARDRHRCRRAGDRGQGDGRARRGGRVSEKAGEAVDVPGGGGGHPQGRSRGGAVMRRVLVMAFLAACSREAGGPPPVAAAPAAAPIAPGIDLSGPVPPPVKGNRPRGKGISLDFGADRAVVKVKLPAPPRGGAAPFTFGDEREGWVAQIPDSVQVPTVAFGAGRVYSSGGF